MIEFDRSSLGFRAQAGKSFRFLVGQGFVAADATDLLVCFERDGFAVNIHHGQISAEIEIEIMLSDGRRFALGEVLEAASPGAAGGYRIPGASTPSAVIKALNEGAELFRQHVLPLLPIEGEMIARLEALRADRARIHAEDEKARYYQQKADVAYKAGDLDFAAEYYGMIESSLSPAERKKLEYCRKWTERMVAEWEQETPRE